MKTTITTTILLILTSAACSDQPLEPGDRDVDLALAKSRGRDRLAFETHRLGTADIFIMDGNGANQSPVVSDPLADDVTPALSPDGTRILFASDADGDFDIYVINVDGTGLDQLTHDPADDRSPAWSPDELEVVFVTDRDGNQEVYKMDIDGTNPTNLSNYGGYDRSPAWSPDGTKIAFESRRGAAEFFDVWVMDPDGSNQVNLTMSPFVEDAEPSWSPDGAKIAYQSNASGTMDIWTMYASGSKPLDMTNNVALDFQPSYSPSGDYIAFVSNRDGDFEIFITTLTWPNTRVKQLTNDPDSDVRPHWGR